MTRCVVIHRNGSTEVLGFSTTVHQQFRGLGYKRFTVELVRQTGQRGVSAAVYAWVTPSLWQATEAARRLWGRGEGDIRAFDEDGALLDLTGSDQASIAG
jgi:hypothetical protein